MENPLPVSFRETGSYYYYYFVAVVLHTYVRTGCPARLCQENSRSAMLAGTGTTKFIAYVLTTPSLT